MTTNADTVRERAWVERHREADATGTEPMWIAEDPVTECAGAGRVEAEAMGNLVAVVVEHETADADEPLLKTPGPVVPREAAPTRSSSSLVDQVLSLF
jgi:hypothetical protein